MTSATDDRYLKTEQPFGRWLIGQIAREDAIGALARSAKADRSFRRTATSRPCLVGSTTCRQRAKCTSRSKMRKVPGWAYSALTRFRSPMRPRRRAPPDLL